MAIFFTITALALIILILMKMKRKIVQKKPGLLDHSGEFSFLNHLNFSSQLVLNNMVLAIDGQHRKLVLLKTGKGKTDCTIIDIDTIRSCTLQKEYFTIEAGGPEKKKSQNYPRLVALHIALENGEHVHLPFFQGGRDQVQDMHESELRAKDWESMLNKMLIKEKRA